MKLQTHEDFYTPQDRKQKRWLRLILLISIVIIWSIAGVLLSAFFFAIWPAPRSSWLELIGNCLAFLPLFLLVLLMPLILKKKVKSTFSASGQIRFKLIFLGFWSWGLLLLAESTYKFLANPEGFRLTFDPSQFFLTLLVALIFITMQATAEEMLFRSAIPVAIGSFVKNPYFILITSSLLFGLPHLSNPEASSDVFVSLLAYSLTGFVWGWVSYKSGGIELAIGAHVINNIYGLVLVGYDNSAISTTSIFKTAELDMTSSLIQSAVMFAIWVLFLKRNQNWNFKNGPKVDSSN